MIIDAYPLSALQAGMLYHSELDGVTFHDHTTLTLRGTFDEAALVRALGELSARHEVLRTSFDLTGFSEPVQLVHDSVDIPLTVSGDAPEYGPFDWTQAPLLRVHVLPQADRFALTVYFHHAILDGWSVATLVSELLARYATPGLPLDPPGARFRDLVAAEKAVLAQPEAAEFWREAIAEAPEGRLPRRPGYPTGGPRHVEVLATTLPGDLTRALAEEAADARVPLRSVLLAAHVRVMGLLTGEPDVLTGMLTHSRPESEAGGEVLGLFLNTIPLRVRADAPDLVQRVFQAEVAALPYRHFPLFEIQRASDRARLLDTHVDFRDFQVYGGAATPIEGQDFFEQTDFAFSAAFVRTPGQGLVLTISYDTTQFPADQIAAIRDHYLRALSGNITISPEDAALLARWNATTRDHPGGLLHELVFEQASRTPDATAVIFEDQRLTYRELASRAREIAAGLDVQVDQPVGVCMERSLNLPVQLLAVLAAGGAFLPLDPNDPEERRNGMLADAHTTPGGHPHPDNLAYVLYTSGSTGRPKGVGISHRAIVNRLRWMQHTFQLTSHDRVLHKTPITFDVSVWELFWPLITGATMVIARPGGHRDTAYLRDLIKTEAITTIHFVPSMLHAFLEEEDIQLPERIICSGEALPPGIDIPGLHNLYGPTEAAVDVSWHPCQPGETVVPIGKPIDNTTLHVLDQHLRDVPIGTPGELYIGGIQLARGYLGKPALTAERFLPAPGGERLYKTGDLARWLPTGELEYLGRTDHQIKIRGMRVELGEIEAVSGAAVKLIDGRLVGYHIGDIPDLTDLLPDHMIPRSWVQLDAFPLTRSGKLDRAALPAPEATSGKPYVPPRDEVEARLARLYEEVLKVPAAGILDDFFELGGHSISALRLAARIRQELGRNLPVATVLAAPTISALGRVLRQPEDLAPPSHVVPLNPDGDRTPIFFIHALGGQVFRYHPLARRLGPDQPVYAIAARGLVPGEEPHATLAEMADAYVTDLLAVRPAGPYVLGGFCIGGNIALEVARRLRERGEQVPLVVLFYANAEEPVADASLKDDTVLLFHALAGGPEETLGLDAAELAARSPEERLLAVMGAAEAADRLAPDTAEVEQARRYLAVFRANAHAVGGYRHEPYDGDVALFAPRREDGGWPSVAKGRLAHVEIPEERVPILYEPLAAGAATEIRKWMDHGIPDH
ncbi:AMP-binding protein [Microtetraspora malaysiensis]|uniref:AMP-binding protein n=1 Tax=Microtetraspora malaysiensis TaxID=161358 RepID=UPI000833E7B9|nr:AMP-binding protein [Microtetraspora malaysiensis]